MVAGSGSGEQVPHDGQDGASDRDDGLLLPAPSSDTSVALTQEGVGLAGHHGCLTQDPGQVGVAVAGGGVALLPSRGLLDPGSEPRP